MKFFHLSDLHLGMRLYNRDLSEDQRHVLAQVIAYAREEQPDAVVLAGDIYDKAVPPAEAVSLFDWFLTELTGAAPRAEILLISGNHDSAARLNLYRALMHAHHVHLAGLPPQKDTDHIERVTLTDAHGPVDFYLLPFVKPSMVKQIVGTDENGNNLSYEETLRRLLEREGLSEGEGGKPSAAAAAPGTDMAAETPPGDRAAAGRRRVLVSHQFYLPVGKAAEDISRADTEVVTVGNIDAISAEVLTPFTYAALGHIHKPMTVGRAAYRYCGTPMAYSVSEAGQKKGVLEVTLGAPGTEPAVRCLPLTPLRAVRQVQGTLEEVLAEPSADYVSVLLTDKVDLDVLDMQERLRFAFPNLLEIRRNAAARADTQAAVRAVAEERSPFALCEAFLPQMDAETASLLAAVINEVQEDEA